MNAHQIQRGLLALLASVLLAINANAQNSYTFELLDIDGSSDLFASGINRHGAIVGNYGGSIYGPDGGMFIKDAEMVTNFTIEGAISGHVSGINDAGTVVGYCTTADSQEVGFSRTRKGVVILLEVQGAGSVRAFGINDHGRIVGQVVDQTFDGLHPFFHGFIAHEGSITLHDLPGKVITRFDQIDSSGRIIGFSQPDLSRPGSSFVTRPHGHYDGPFSLPEAASASPLAISPSGILAGIYTDEQGLGHSFVWKHDKMTTIDLPAWNWAPDFTTNDPDFGPLHFALQNSGSYITGINDHGDIVGVNSAYYFDDNAGVGIEKGVSFVGHRVHDQ